MCRAVTCKKCGKTTWAGCGQHTKQVMAGVPTAQRCAGHENDCALMYHPSKGTSLMSAPAFTALTIDELQARRDQLTLVDVRSPGEFASGHVPGAHNIPLDQLERALPDLRTASGNTELAFICASGNRSRHACQQLAADGIGAANVTGGTAAWAQAGKPLDADADARPVWAMDRQVRLVAGSTVLAGLAAGLARPRARWLSAGIAAGLVYSAVSGTCAMASLLGKLPYNQRDTAGYDLDAVLATLRKTAM